MLFNLLIQDTVQLAVTWAQCLKAQRRYPQWPHTADSPVYQAQHIVAVHPVVNAGKTSFNETRYATDGMNVLQVRFQLDGRATIRELAIHSSH